MISVLLAKYTLEGRSLKITYEVENTDTKKFSFFIGGHPGFNCPLVLGEEYTDYEIVFEQKEHVRFQHQFLRQVWLI